MRIKEINGILHDLHHVYGWRNPLNRSMLPKKGKVDLLTGEIFHLDEDDLEEFYKDKIKWFQSRINDLHGKLSDFTVARINISGFKEKVQFIYKNRKFVSEFVFEFNYPF